MATVREDVVKVSFDIDGMSDLNKSRDALDDLKKIASEGVGGDAFDEMAKEGKKAAEVVEGVKEGLDGIKPDGLDDTNDSLKQTKKEGEKAHDKLKGIAKQKFDKTVSGLKSLAKELGKVGIAAGKLLAKGIAVGVAGVGALVGKSVTNFADYEQLVGGVDTLFKASSNRVQKNAQNAFRTAGLSENEYMTTVTSFSASLIKSLGGDTLLAAKYADRAIVDMADNANKMGTDMASIQDAYQGFAKQNYTMLDNLKLGYGGTQEEMKRLLADAGKLAGQKFDIKSYADVVQAIHVIQESMGIAGTTAKEANETISGSFASMKAAWSNTLTALILGGADFDRCVDNLVDSAKVFGKNIMPAVTKALSGVGELIGELAPLIEKELPGLIKTLLPPLLKAATSLVKGVIVALPDIIRTIIDELPTILSEVWGAVKEAFGDVPGLAKAEAFFGKLKTWFTDNADTIKALIPAILGLAFAFKLFNKLKGITGLFGGGSGSTGKGFFGSLASMKTGTVLKGFGNLAIIVGGLVGLAALLMWAAPYMAQLSDMKSIGEVLLVTGLVGLLGTSMTKLAASVGNIPVMTVLKGVANIGIALVGFGGLAAVLMWLAPYMAQLSDLGTTMKILLIIGVTGLVGTALAGLAGLVGAIPIVAVLSGLGNIALALGGFALIATAFGALQKVDGFTELLNSGGQVLADICGIIGDMAGNLIGGALAGLSDSLPDIGTNISAFATAIAPALDTFGSAKTDGISDFATALSSLIGVLVGENISSFFFGEIDYAGLGTKLSDFATNAATFFSTVKDIPDESFGKITSLFNALSGIKGLPTEGGLKSFLTGDINFDSIASGLQSLASDGFIGAINKIKDIPAAGFTAITNLFNALGDIKGLPKEGGVADFFTGSESTTLTSIAAALPGIATNIASFFTNLGGRTDFTPIKSLFDTLGSIEIDTDAAKKSWGGLGSSALEDMGTSLGSFATNAATFFTTVNSLNLANLTGFFDNLGTAGKLPETLSSLDSSVGTSLSNLVTTADTKLSELKSAFSDELGAIVALMYTTATSMYYSGVAIMLGVNNGMNSMRGTLIATAASIAAAIQSAFNVRLDINSPSREGFKSGVFVGEGIDLGMQSKIPDLRETATDMGSASIPYASHYSPDSDGGTVYNNRTSNEYTTISPAFNLTISGTQDDRSTARKVKRWVNQSMQEFFESLDRKNPKPREA